MFDAAAVVVPSTCAFVTRTTDPATRKTSLSVGAPVAPAPLKEIDELMAKAKAWEEEAEVLEEQARALELEEESVAEVPMMFFAGREEMEHVALEELVMEEETKADTLEVEEELVKPISNLDDTI